MGNLNKDVILRELAVHRETIQSYGVESLSLFGSYAYGTETGNSDIDLLVEFRDGRGLFRDFTGLHAFLEDLFEVRVELVKTKLLREGFREAILGGQVYAAEL